MTINITLTPETEAKLRRRAASQGKDVVDFAREAVEEKLAVPESFGELLRPIHEAQEAKNINIHEFDALVEKCRDEIAAEKQSRQEQ